MLNLDNIQYFSTPIIAAILGIAFPLIIQSITNIDSKYDSQRLIARFKRERLYYHLWISLIVAIAASLYNYMTEYPWTRDWGPLNRVMENSSNLLLMVATIYLIITLFLIVNLLTIYFNYKELFNRLKPKGKKNYILAANETQDFTDLGIYILLKDDKEPTDEFYQFFQEYVDDIIAEVSKEQTIQITTYDKWFYEAILSINNILIKSDTLLSSTIGGNDFSKLLIPNISNYEISSQTYSTLWTVLQQQVIHKRDEWIYDYWSYAYQHRLIIFKPSEDSFSDNPGDEEKTEILQHNARVKQFEEFHIALCSYILYKGEYSLLKQITEYSQTEPYRFPLTSSSFADIFDKFKEVAQIDPKITYRFQNQYNFHGVKGISAGEESQGWYLKYLTLLLFRLNSFQVKYSINLYDPWRFPYVPQDSASINNYKKVAEWMMRLLKMWKEKSNMDIINTLGWNIKDEPDPEDKLNEFINQLDDDFESSQKDLTLSSEKFDNMKSSAKKILEERAYIYKAILEECKDNEEVLKKKISEKSIVWEQINVSSARQERKDVFSDEGVTNHLNYDTIDAKIAEMNFLNDYSLMFRKYATKRYTIDSDDLLTALDKLIDKNTDKYEIIAFGVNLYPFLHDGSNLIRLAEEDETTENDYNYRPYLYRDKLKINMLPSTKGSVINSVLMIIKKENMPCYQHTKPNEETIKAYQYKPVDASENQMELYASVIFNNFPEAFKHLEDSDQCLVSLYYKVNVFWKSNAEVTMLKVLTPFTDSGKGMDVNELPRL